MYCFCHSGGPRIGVRGRHRNLLKRLDAGSRECVVISFLSFRTSAARYGIQHYQELLDTGLRRYDEFDDDF